MEGKFTKETVYQSPQEPSIQETREKLPDVGEIIKEGHNAAESAIAQVSADLEQAEILQKQLGPSALPIVEKIQNLRDEIQQEQAAFDVRAERFNSPYVLSRELAKVLKVARILKRPLLLEGEPGTGKTSLAYALAAHEDLPIIHAQCKSTTTAQELLYTFDVVQRLQDAQLGKDVSDPRKYVKLGPLGRAFSTQEQVILLIDEVDKAKRDFSNDLLHELDQMSFFITETGEEVAAKHRPIVIITSNHERDLPEPVLRRCIYHWIEFPSPEQMTEIVKAHVPDVSEKLLQSAIRRFYEIRQIEELEKKPSTSEMLDWIKVLREFGIEEIDREDTPFLETLLKYKDDINLVLRQKQETTVQIPEVLLAAMSGDYYVVKVGNESYRNKLYTLLANKGYSFTTEKWGDERCPFEIHGEGIRRVGDFIFAISKNSPLYQRLKDDGLISEEFIKSEGPIEFSRIEESNKFYTLGENEQNKEIYKTSDGQIFFWREVKKNE